jgi:hypothetical protein
MASPCGLYFGSTSPPAPQLQLGFASECRRKAARDDQRMASAWPVHGQCTNDQCTTSAWPAHGRRTGLSSKNCRAGHRGRRRPQGLRCKRACKLVVARAFASVGAAAADGVSSSTTPGPSNLPWRGFANLLWPIFYGSSWRVFRDVAPLVLPLWFSPLLSFLTQAPVLPRCCKPGIRATPAKLQSSPGRPRARWLREGLPRA